MQLPPQSATLATAEQGVRTDFSNEEALNLYVLRAEMLRYDVDQMTAELEEVLSTIRQLEHRSPLGIHNLKPELLVRSDDIPQPNVFALRYPQTVT